MQEIQNFCYTNENRLILDLRSINISNTFASDRGVSEILKTFVSLQKINLAFVPIRGECFSMHTCLKLQEINMENCSMITEQALIKLSELCPNLQNINIQFCFKITDTAIIKLAENCPKLSKISIIVSKDITDPALIKLAEKCQNLQEINLKHSRNITDQTVEKLAENCPSLKAINFEFCSRITGLTFIKLAEKCQNLQQIACNADTLLMVALNTNLLQNYPNLLQIN